MITVRFPSGHSVTYNSAERILRESYGTKILTISDHLVAIVAPEAAVIYEWLRPCKVQFGRDDEVITAVLSDLRKYPTNKLAELKKALGQFNAHTGVWKP